jgi:hypothetical protein
MKTLLNLSALIAFLAVARPSMGMISIDEVTTAKAKQLGIELTAKANGPKEAWIKLEFKPEGPLKDFQHVSLEIRDGDHFLLGWAPLKDKRSASGTVVVGVMANRDFLNKVTLRIVTGATDDVGHDLRVKDFFDLKNSTDPRLNGFEPLPSRSR